VNEEKMGLAAGNILH